MQGRLSIQADRIKSALTKTAFALRGRRSCLFVLLSGSGRFLSDGLEAAVEGPCLIWLPVGESAGLSLPAGTRGFVLRMSETTLGRAIPPGAIAGYVRHAIASRVVLTQADPMVLARLGLFFDEIEGELFENRAGAEIAIQHLVWLVLMQVWRASGAPNQRQDRLPRRIVHDFLSLVELHMTDHWTVARYAQHLNVSRDRLNAAVRRSLGTTPHGHIQGRLIEETKRLLLQSDLPVAEIAYRLGFGDAAYFNRFFQRHENLPPGRFRRRYAEEVLEEAQQQSYAAWP